eukprot:CAMPEP_0116579778 /NCGR_PEP_ID=MMETSP0397-20121206/22431_1 /TAXON_ID=216820 /ORGANISM="Cyclophora tenuis, Strain ECT3854" /LENGTH=358 /DNA_ID=CAMNT_0004109277 /DNA_START=88 /DNA_END=1164 /DNA_ORIENTATION=-
MDHADRKIAPDMPEMRSVRIGAPVAMPPRSLLRSAPTTTKSATTPLRTIATSTAEWKPSNIPSLPQMYPLERSHARVKNDTSAVAQRIASVLRQQSLAPVFEDQKASGETQCHVRFVVRLFVDGDDLVVEVQRRSGCCFVFHQVSKALLQAARGETVMALPAFVVPNSMIKEEQQRAACDEALELANELLLKDRIDAQVLGMQSLVHMTREGGCKYSASAILKGPVMDTLLKFVRLSKGIDDEFLVGHRTNMRGDAFHVLANCLAREASKMSFDKFASDQVLKSVIDELRVAAEKPHNACHAARVLASLVKNSEAIKLRAEQLDAPAAIIMAFNEGISRHAMLEEEAKALKREMANCM